MKRALFLLVLPLLWASCQRSYDPSRHLSAAEQDAFMTKVIRYLAKAPEGISQDERFYAAYDTYYEGQKSKHRLDAFFQRGDTAYFLVSRQAPSLTEKRVATGGKATWKENGELDYYEEVFRTWKMPDTTLVRKSMLLYDGMIQGISLEPYLMRNSAPEEYIEFPDDHTYFDKVEKRWKSR